MYRNYLHITELFFFLLFYIYTLKVVVSSIAVVWLTCQAADLHGCMFIHFILMKEILFHMT